MAREHHCPNDGPQACNAATSKIHTCGLCGSSWEEDLTAPVAAPVVRPTASAGTPPAAAAAGKPATPPPAAPVKPAATPAAAPPKPPAPAAPAAPPAANPAPPATNPTPPPAATAPPSPPPPSAAPPAPPKPAAPVAPAPPPKPEAAAASPASPPESKLAPAAPPPGEPAASTTYREEFVGQTDGLAAKLKAAKVATCPRCQSPNVAAPSQYLETGGRLVLADGQSYRAHWWYADTGEPFTPPAKAAPHASA